MRVTWKLALGVFAVVGLAAALPTSATEDLRAQLLALPLTDKLGGATTRPVATKDAFTFVAGNASDEHKAQFVRGNAVFTAAWVAAPGPNPALDGLGPLFNRASCFECHIENGRGAPPKGPREQLESSLVRVSVAGFDPNGGPKPVPIYGDQIQDRGLPGVPPEAVPRLRWKKTAGSSLRWPAITLSKPGYGPLPPDTMMSFRVSNPVIGLGLLEAVPEDTLDALSDPDDADGDGISGRKNIVFDMATKKKKPDGLAGKPTTPACVTKTPRLHSVIWVYHRRCCPSTCAAKNRQRARLPPAQPNPPKALR